MRSEVKQPLIVAFIILLLMFLAIGLSILKPEFKFMQQSPEEKQRAVAEACIDAFRDDFRDPLSVQYYSHELLPNGQLMHLTVRATNAFNAYGTEKLYCYLNSDGEFNAEESMRKAFLRRVSQY